MTVWQSLGVAAAGVVAGATSAMAGGASLLTFPVLLGLGLPPLAANVTNTTGLVPTALGAALASREELSGQRPLAALLAVPMVLGALGGAAVLLLAPSDVFAAVAPLLIALSSLLLFAQPWIVARMQGHATSNHRRGAWIAAFVVGLYVGYFGAAAAVLFLALIGLFTAVSLHRLNALKNVVIGAGNAVAAIVFVLIAPVDWAAAAALAAGSLAGGAAGVRLARRVRAEQLRLGIAAVGLAVAAWMAFGGA
jgi:uncharacterized protein